jgi:hypothetical protein
MSCKIHAYLFFQVFLEKGQEHYGKTFCYIYAPLKQSGRTIIANLKSFYKLDVPISGNQSVIPTYSSLIAIAGDRKMILQKQAIYC